MESTIYLIAFICIEFKLILPLLQATVILSLYLFSNISYWRLLEYGLSKQKLRNSSLSYSSRASNSMTSKISM